MASTSRAATPCKASKGEMDRFIPNRSAVDVDLAHFSFIKENDPNKANQQQQETALLSPSKEEYKRRLAEGLLESNGSQSSRILAFKTKAPAPPEGYDTVMRSLYTANAGPRVPRKQHRAIPQAPERILDAPELLDDYYLNLIDWSSTNVLAVALAAAQVAPLDEALPSERHPIAQEEEAPLVRRESDHHEVGVQTV